MEKEFIPYEQALLLKELGFDEPCLAFYNGSFLDSTQYDFDEGTSKDIGMCTKAPLYQQAFRFLYKELGRDGFGVMPIDTDKCNKELNRLIEIVKEK